MLESASRGGCLPGPGGGGWCLPGPRGVSAWFPGGLPGPGGVCLVPGGCLPGPRGVSAWSGGCLPGLGGCLPGPGGDGIPACTEADTLPPCGQTHTCKNITLATTSLWPVIKHSSRMYTTCFSDSGGSPYRNPMDRDPTGQRPLTETPPLNSDTPWKEHGTRDRDQAAKQEVTSYRD